MPLQLELIHVNAASPSTRPPILLLHGAFAGAWCWQQVQQDLATAGWESYALSLRGHGNSDGAMLLASATMNDYIADVQVALDTIGRPCVLIGHSLGGYLAQHIAERQDVAALALLASIPPYGLSGSLTFMSALHPNLLMGLQSFALGHTQKPESALLQHLLFAKDTDMSVVDDFAQHAQLESMAALSELWMPQFWKNMPKMPSFPVLVLGAGDDSIIPYGDVQMTAQAWGVSPVMLPEAGHAMMCDRTQPLLSECLINWLAQIA
ncbi:alpha/beta fold hydrolase [Chitinibacter bivalviorum]|uniref:Alpha/beta fold hydrolase n=1 Tax=Chitinibacter bivalviorum TaxID=2739434 RepID=A0A7H9BE63_9NEIS|nr:alpha/beta fold hydrolase [Chitinibacter bivalviorum]QLG86909.1 alpha/beta fold hydrolase [Chitinibacter bivalviorum]